MFQAAFPPVEELSIQRIVLPEANLIEIEVVNGGPDPVTIAQVIVDEAYWNFTIAPGNTIPRLATATITIPKDFSKKYAEEQKKKDAPGARDQ